jgi:hypothetical protein
MRARWAIAVAVSVIAVAAVVLLVTRGSDDQRYGATGTILEAPGRGPELCLGAIAESYPPQCGGPPIDGWDWRDVDDEESASGTTWVSAYVEGTFDGERFTLTARPSAPRFEQPETPSFAPACNEPETVDNDAGANAFGTATEQGGLDQLDGLVGLWVSDPSGEDYDGPFVANFIVRPGRGEAAKAQVRRFWSGALCVVERDQKTTKELDEIVSRIDGVLTQQLLTASPNYQEGVVEVQVIVVDERSQREVEEAFGKGVVRLTGALKPV